MKDLLHSIYLNVPSPIFMAMCLLIAWALVTGVTMLVREALYRLGWITLYRWERNPYRRWCRRCGARHELYQYAMGGQQWEHMGGGHEGCSCRR